MSTMLKISEAASLALHSMVALAADPDESIANRELASRLHASEAHLSKVLQRLAKSGLVRSIRGPNGGFMLGKPPDEISLLDVYESIDGRLVPSGCLFNAPIWDGGNCILGGLLEVVDKQTREYLARTKLNGVTGCVQEIKNTDVQKDNQH